MKTLSLTYRDFFAPQELEGFSPQLSRLVYGLEYVRANTLFAVQGLNTAQLDTQLWPGGNTIGMLLAHFAGTKRGYQMLTFDRKEDGFERPENVLGEAGRAEFQGHPLEFYVQRMAQVRADTLAGLRQRDDIWLGAPFRAFDWPQDINAHWCWFHVLEDELRHQGQITVLRKEIERRELPMTHPTHLTYSGIPTFARAPLVDPSGDWRSDVAVLGVPFDIALGFRPGARFAPRALREASLRSVPPFTGLDGRTRLAGVTFADASDVILPSLEPELAHERTTEAARAVRQRCKVPVFLGGDHSVSFPLLRAFADVPDLHIVQLDAHLDFTDVRNDTRWSNSSPFRRACEALPNLTHITTVGLRGLRFDPEAVAAARARGHTLIPMEDVSADLNAVLERLPQGKNVYFSVDVDGFDPAVIPGTSSPEPDGLTYAQGMKILAAAAAKNNIVGMDVVELAPGLDPTGRSELLMARLMMETLCEVFDHA